MQIRELLRALIVNYVKCFKMFLDIDGRASRYQFWGFMTVSLAIAIFLEILYLISEPLLPIVKIYIALAALPTFSATIRRMHDTNRSAWSLLWIAGVTVGLYFAVKSLTPLFVSFDIPGLIAALAIVLFPLYSLVNWLCLPGDPYENNYGEKIKRNKIHERVATSLGVTMLVVYFLALLLPLCFMMYDATGTFNIFFMLF